MINELARTTAGALWYIFPAYVANASAVLARGRTPIDGGEKFLDGKPLLGRGKTIEGFILSVTMGSMVGTLQGYISLGNPLSLLLPNAFMLSVGAMVGDAAGSFLKRRFDLERGEAVPLLDQWDFIVGALLFGYLSSILFGIDMAIALPSDMSIILMIFVMTPVFHIFSNWVAFKAGLKSEPW